MSKLYMCYKATGYLLKYIVLFSLVQNFKKLRQKTREFDIHFFKFIAWIFVLPLENPASVVHFPH